MSEQSTAPTPIAPDARPRLPHGVRLVHSEAQGGWVLLAPERVFKADPIAAEIVKRCTGDSTFAAIVDDLAQFCIEAGDDFRRCVGWREHSRP